MQPYAIRRGDYLLKVAYENGFDAEAVWGNARNADLRTLRKDANILAPGNVLYVPAPPDPPVSTALRTGSTNAFVSPAPATPVTVKFSEPGLVSQACTFAELPDLTGLSTDGNGVLTFQAPVSLETVTITLAGANPAVTFTCEVGHLDPIDTLSGVFQRLQNLGYVEDDAEFDQGDLDLVRGGLNALNISTVGSPSGLALSAAAASDSGSDAPQAAVSPL